MATPLKIKRSAVSNKRPTISDLQLGELALNTYDGYLFAERDTGGVGIGTTVTLLTPWRENFGAQSIYYINSVGIGTTNPQTKLEIDGVLGFTPNSNGYSNIRIGTTVTGYSITNTSSANKNIFIGDLAGGALSTGLENVFIGMGAGAGNINGSYNVYLGSGAGVYADYQGSKNVYIGYSVVSSGIGSENIVIGYNRSLPTSGNNQLVIGSGSSDWIVGNSSYNVGIGTINPTSKLTVTGDVLVSGVVTATTFIGNLTGTATTASSVIVDSVGLGTHTYGDYVKNITGTSNQISVSATSGEGSTPTLSIPNQFTIPQDATVTRDLQVNRNLNVTGNITIGGTSAAIFAQELKIADPDIVLGFRTDGSNNDVSNDTTANHGGIAIASTEGNPLVTIYNPGIGESTLPTYKKIMWFKAGTFAGLGTDAWIINYAVGIGSTQFPTGTRLAAGNVQFTQSDLAVVRNINASGIITAAGQIQSTQANNTADGGGQIYLNGATGNRIDFNTNGVAAPAFTTRSVGTRLVLSPNITGSTVDIAFGIESSTLWSSVSNSTQQFKWYAGTTNIATLSGTGVHSIYTDGSTLYGPNTTWGASLRVGGNGNADTTNASVVTTNGNLHLDAASGGSATYLNYYKGTGGIYFGNGAGAFNASINSSGVFSTVGQITSTQANSTTTGGGQIYLNGATGNRIDFANAGVAAPTFTTRSAGTKIVLYPSLGGSSVDYGFGIDSATLWSSVESSSAQFKWYAGTTNIATLFGTGELVLGTTTKTGTASQPLQVTGGAYVSGSVGIGTTNPTTALQVQGTTQIQTSVGSTQSIWTRTLDSKNGSANNVSLLVQPETVYNFDASQTASRTYEPVVFSNALTSASIPYTPTLYSLSNYTNVALTTSNASANISAFGFSNTVYRNSTTDLGLNPSIRLYGINNSIFQGTNVDQSVVTGYAYGNYNAIDIQKARASTIYGDYNSISVGTLSNYSAFSNYAYGFYSTLGTGASSGTGIGTVTNFYAYYATARISATGRVTNYYGLYLATPSVTGIITNRYSIYSEDTSALMYHAGSVGIGTTNPVGQLQVSSGPVIIGAATSTGTASQPLQVTGGAYVSGTLGLGVVSPTSKLVIGGFGVNNTLRFADGAFIGDIGYVDSSGNLTIQNWSDIIFKTGDPTRTEKLRVNSSGNLLINTTTETGTASQPLQVTGGVYISGNIGIGTTNPTSKLHVVGNAYITGVTTSTDFDSLSDINLKTNINQIPDPLEKVKQIRGVTFDWKETQRSSAGVIAQEIEKVLPELVHGEETKTVNYNGLIGLLIECVKKQQEEIDELKKRL